MGLVWVSNDLLSQLKNLRCREINAHLGTCKIYKFPLLDSVKRSWNFKSLFTKHTLRRKLKSWEWEGVPFFLAFFAFWYLIAVMARFAAIASTAAAPVKARMIPRLFSLPIFLPFPSLSHFLCLFCLLFFSLSLPRRARREDLFLGGKMRWRIRNSRNMKRTYKLHQLWFIRIFILRN